jgi:hypothetical protein
VKKQQKLPKKMTQLWRTLEAIPQLAAVKAEWRFLLGDELPAIERLLRMRQRLAASYPRLERSSVGLPLRVVDHGGGEFAGVCEETGESISLSQDDLIVYELDHKKFSERVTASFKLSAAPITAGKPRFPLIVGYSPAVEPQIPVIFTSPRSSDEFFGNVMDWNSKVSRRVVWLTPTRRFWSTRVEQAICSIQCGLFALQELIDINAAGCWATLPMARKILAFGADSLNDEPLCDRAQLVLIGMQELNATKSDSRRSTDDIAKRSLGGEADANALKALISDLKTRGYIKTKTGSGGGCWLTDKGIARAQRLQLTSPETP